MTIEAKIEELTAAVIKLSDVFAKYAVPVFTPLPTADTLEKIAAKLDEPKLVEEPKKKKVEVKAKEKPEPENVEVETKVIEYATVRDKVLALIKDDPNNRDKILDVLSKFGAETAKQLKPEQYKEALEKLNKIGA